jgi:hypothetical protein
LSIWKCAASGKVALDAEELRPRVPVELALGHLDLHDLGAEVSEEGARRRGGDEARELDDADAGEGGGHRGGSARIG